MENMSSDDDMVDAQREKFKSERNIDYDYGSRSSEDNELDVSSCFGPILPPHLISKHNQNTKNDAHQNEFEKDYGDVSETKEMYGPQIPTATRKQVIGPEIPAHLFAEESNEDDEEMNKKEDVEYGPSVSLMTDVNSEVKTTPSAFCKPKKNVETVKKRESWMTELPPERAAVFGLGARQFRAKLPNDSECDRSGWTETPLDKDKEKSELRSKKNDEKIMKQKQIDERNQEMERLIRKLEKKKKKKEKKESLLVLHQKKLKKKMKKESKKRGKDEKPVERRPFDRNIDLQVNRFDECQKRAVLKKAALLNDRFASGESKFL